MSLEKLDSSSALPFLFHRPLTSANPMFRTSSVLLDVIAVFCCMLLLTACGEDADPQPEVSPPDSVVQLPAAEETGPVLPDAAIAESGAVFPAASADAPLNPDHWKKEMAALHRSVGQPPAPQPGNLLYIGVLAPFTGQHGAAGLDIARGVRAAALLATDNELLTEYDGVRLVLEDTACQPYQAVSGANGLLAAQQPVAAVVGGVCTPATLAASEILAQNNTLMISPAASGLRITKRNLSHIFRLSADDNQQAALAIRFARMELNATSVFIIDDGRDSSKELADTVAAYCASVALPTAGRASVDVEARKYETSLLAAKESQADVVYLALQEPEAAAGYLLAAQAAGVDAATLGPETLMQPSFLELAGTSSQKCYFTAEHGYPLAPARQMLTQSFTQLGFANPGLYAARAFDAGYAVLLAARATGGHNATAMAETMGGVHFQGISGTVAFDADNNGLDRSLAVYQAVNGKYVMRWEP